MRRGSVRQERQRVSEHFATEATLEVNAEHALVKKLEGSTHFDDLAHILFDQALLAEGGLPDDPAAAGPDAGDGRARPAAGAA